jgi:hypothetical protein
MNLNELGTDRANRPSVNSPILVRSYFMNDGNFINPERIVSVSIFPKSADLYPESLIDAQGILQPSMIAANAVAHYETDIGSLNNGTVRPATEYTVGSSEIFRNNTGEYFVILDSIAGNLFDGPIHGSEILGSFTNRLEYTGEYIDAWVLRYPGESNYKVVFNQLTVYNDTFYSTTEPLLIKSYNNLITKRIALGSKSDLKITTEFTVENRNIDQTLKDLFKSALAVNPKIKIEKLNEDTNLPARVEVFGYSDTIDLIRTTSENTFVFTWDTEELKTHPQLLSGNLGNMRGVYVVTLQYDLLNERIVTPQMYVQLI